MAKELLLNPATFAPSEVLYSKIADVVTKNQNRLLRNTTKILETFMSRGVILNETELDFDKEEDSMEVDEISKLNDFEVEPYTISNDLNDDKVDKTEDEDEVMIVSS